MRAILGNSDQVLVPGNFVRVRVGAADEQESLLVPDAALGSDQGGRYSTMSRPGFRACINITTGWRRSGTPWSGWQPYCTRLFDEVAARDQDLHRLAPSLAINVARTHVNG